MAPTASIDHWPSIVCLSPHPDDAALSCGGLLAQRRPARVVTVFAGPPPPPEALSPLAHQLHLSWGNLPDPVAHRRAEDTQAIATLGAVGETWGYGDAIYRHPAYATLESIFGPPAEETALEEELCARCAALPGDLLLFPLAVGNHVDHQLLFRVGWRVLAAGRPAAFYEDVPYVAWEGGPAPRLANLGRPLWPRIVDITAQWPLKTAAISCYPSQLPSLARGELSLLEAVRRYAASLRPGGYAERLWSVDF